ncbi:type II secretion system F family protein [Infirmifilum lucidum]|uniref:Type II secretion system F family protein n=1 Tax=Infirmifilum lucidum TaxID=2776706 RepID=A0A7L9FL47_9CREN|nr:type II secretion system F family protein [Infirmifilum lucidum]QOJ79555.1 type II secretion system F family protein [Infirmifilum lucidum]
MIESLTARFLQLAEPFRQYYERAGFNDPFETYILNVARALVLLLITSAVVLTLIHVSLFNMNPLLALPASLLLTFATTAIFTGLALYYPVYRTYSRRVSIEKDLPFTVAYMASLASSGMGLERLLERVAVYETNRELRRELFLTLRDIKALGLDTLTALARLASRSPSALLSSFILALREAYATSGDLKSVLMHYAKLMLDEKTQRLRSLVNTLSMLAEVYTTMMVAAPLMFITMLIVMNVLGGGVLGLSPDILILVLTFIVIPFSALGIYIAIDGLMSRV